MKLAVIGSRDFNDYDLLSIEIDRLNPSMIVSGGARGADTLARNYAKEHNLKLTEFYPKWDSLGKKAGYVRNYEIVSFCDCLIAFWDGKSKGTKISIDIAKKQNKLIRVVIYE